MNGKTGDISHNNCCGPLKMELHLTPTIVVENIQSARTIVGESQRTPNSHVSWSKILTEFGKRFEEVYDPSSCKLHLDASQTLVDGATSKWCEIALLDTIVAFLTGGGIESCKVKRERERRKFNQYQAFKDSIWAILTETESSQANAALNSSDSIAADSTSTVANLSVPPPSSSIKIESTSTDGNSTPVTNDATALTRIVSSLPASTSVERTFVVDDMSHPWDNIEILRTTLSETYISRSKSWGRRYICVNYLCDKILSMRDAIESVPAETEDDVKSSDPIAPLGLSKTATVRNNSSNKEARCSDDVVNINHHDESSSSSSSSSSSQNGNILTTTKDIEGDDNDGKREGEAEEGGVNGRDKGKTARASFLFMQQLLSLVVTEAMKRRSDQVPPPIHTDTCLNYNLFPATHIIFI
jgi:hypothetical protein